MEVVKGVIEKSEFKSEWSGKNGVIYYHTLTVDGKTGEIGAKEKNPQFLSVGQEIEVDVSQGQYGLKFKRVNGLGGDGKKGFGKKKVRTYNESLRMAKSTAVKVSSTINSLFDEVVIKVGDLNKITSYVIGDIKGDIDKWDSPEGDEMMIRQMCVHCAAEEIKARDISKENIADSIVDLAKSKYRYIYG